VYVGDNPVNRVDPSGKDWCLPVPCRIVGWYWFVPIFGGEWCIVEWQLADFLCENAGVTLSAASACITGFLGIGWTCKVALATAWALLAAGQFRAALAAFSACATAIAYVVGTWCAALMIWIIIGILSTGYCK